MPLKGISTKFNGVICNVRNPDFAIFTDDFKLSSLLALKTGAELVCACFRPIFAACNLCSEGPRYPCPAEREKEDLSDIAFELDISLAINRAWAAAPEVDKQL